MARNHRLLAGVAIVCVWSTASQAAAQIRQFDIKGQPASTGIPLFARQAKLQILVQGDAARGLHVRAVKGRMDVASALRRLLDGTNLVPVIDGSNVVLRPAQVAEVGAGAPDPVPVQNNGQDIVVTGLRQSLQAAQDVKRNSDEIVDSIVAEDIGKLPDVTAAESLARVTGVQVTRAEGEASGVRIRGLPDLTTTYNGREIFTAEGRSVALQDFPAPSISRIDVYKSGSANLVEPGIAGLIDVRSRKPFDFKGGRIAGGVTGVHWYQSQKLAVDANLLISQRWRTGIGEIGFLIEGSYTNNNFLDSSRNVSQSILSRTGVPGTTGAIRYPSFVNVDYVTGKRWRPSVSAALQWRPSRTLEFYLDGLFQGYRAENAGRNFNIATGVGATLSNITYFEGTNLVRSVTMTGGALPTGTQNATSAHTDTWQAGGGFIWKPGKARVTGDVAFTDSTYTQLPFAINYTLTVAPPRNFNFDTPQGDGGGTVTVGNFNLFDPALYRMTSMSEGGTRNHGRSTQARLDVDYPVHAFGVDRLQLGMRYSNRDADSRTFTRSGNAPAGQFFPVLPLAIESAPGGFRSDDVDTVHKWLTPTRDSLLAQADYLRRLTGLSQGRPAFGAPVYVANEKSYAAYVQGRYSFDLGVPVDGLIGVRAIRTENEINGTVGFSNGANPAQPITRNKKYTDYLPNVSARLKFTPELQLRLAFTQTRTRPTFGNLNPSLTLGLPTSACGANPNDPTNPDCFRPASGGNPDLDPIRSNNYDASLEYYFTRTGSLTVGVFHRDVTGFINNTTTQVVDSTYGRLNINRPENGGRGKISGVEAGFRTFLRASWLPTWLNDFGVLANYTYLDHKSELSPALAATLSGFQPLSGVSKHLANLSGFYENRYFSTRLSYNYRSDFVVSYGQVADPALPNNALGPTLPITERGRGTVDLASTVTPVENITISFNVVNLLGQSGRNSRTFNAQGQSYPFQTRFLESIYRLGVRFRF